MEDWMEAGTGLGVEDHVERVVVVGDDTPQAREVEVVLDVVLIYLYKKFVALETAKPLDPGLIFRRELVRVRFRVHLDVLLASLLVGRSSAFASLLW
jgi:hypothetical protein